MNWTDDEIDKLVQESADTQRVEYKDAYWKEMEGMLDQKKTKKSGFWWWMSGGALLLVGMGVYLSLNSTESNSNKQLASNLSLTSSVAEIDLLSETKNSTEQKEEADKITGIIEENALSEKLNSGVPMVSPLKVENQMSQSRVNVSTLNATTGNSVTNVSGRLSKEDANVKSIDDESLILKYLENTSPQKGSHGDENYLGHTINDLNTLPWETALSSEFELVNREHKIFPRTRLGFYTSVNVGIGQSYLSTQTNNDMYQIGVDAGVEYFKGSWVFGVGVGLRQQYARNLELIDRRSYYSFGIVNVKSNLSYDQLIFADINLHAGHSFGRSELGIVLTPTYLLGTRLSYNQVMHETIGSQVNEIGKETVNHKYVSSSNFNLMGLNAGITYCYALPRNFVVQLEANTRINNALLTSKFEGITQRMPLMLEVGIKKRF